MPSNLYKRGDTWWLRISINGVEHRESLHTSDGKIARKARDQRIKSFSEARWGEAKTPWKAVVAAWAEHVSGQLAPNTLKRYSVSLAQVEPYLSPFDISAIDGKAIAALATERRKVASSATVRRDLSAVSGVLQFAEHLGLREGNPTLSKRKLYKERRDPIVLPDHADIEAVIAGSSPCLGALIRAAWLTGCRQDELVRATRKSFNPRTRTLEIIGKGSKRRMIVLSEAAASHFLSQPRVLGSDLIFPKEDGTAYTQTASDFGHARWLVEKRAKAAKVPFRRFRYHDLRHLFAVEALRSGVGIYALSKYLGHSSVKTTEVHYLAFLTPEEADEAKTA